ncbi:MAG: RDD family protein [Burkholderiaceae bacterium]
MTIPAAHPWRRFMGGCYEAIILFGVLWFVGYAYSALTRLEGMPGWQMSGFRIVLFVVLGAYFVGFWRAGYRTLPMKTVSLQLVDRNDRPVGTLRAIVRYLAAAAMLIGALAIARYVHPLGLLLLIVPGAWAWLDRDSQALYDRVAGTRLVTWDPPELAARTKRG